MADQNGQDPSMEDILASIRRILSEDDGDEGAPEPEPTPEPAPEPEPELEPEPEQFFEEEASFEEEPEPEPIAAYEPPPQEDVFDLADTMVYEEAPKKASKDEDFLVSQPVAQVSACAIAHLAKVISEDRNVAIGGHGLTLEELVRQILRPFVKEWLDANLPYVVERLVKKEIERVVDKASSI